jgi:hypothetical protein
MKSIYYRAEMRHKTFYAVNFFFLSLANATNCVMTNDKTRVQRVKNPLFNSLLEAGRSPLVL